jgi:hypothetical protein
VHEHDGAGRFGRDRQVVVDIVNRLGDHLLVRQDERPEKGR